MPARYLNTLLIVLLSVTYVSSQILWITTSPYRLQQLAKDVYGLN